MLQSGSFERNGRRQAAGRPRLALVGGACSGAVFHRMINESLQWCLTGDRRCDLR